AMNRCASGGIIWSSVATKYQRGFVFHAASVTAPLRASRPHGTCDSAMNAASGASTSAANAAANFDLSSMRNPSFGGRIGGTEAPRRRIRDQLRNRFAVIGRERGDVDESNDSGIIAC